MAEAFAKTGREESVREMIQVPKSLKEFADIFVAGKVVYISGPITGVEDYQDRFRAAELTLTGGDVRVLAINPAKALPEGLAYEDYMDVDLKMVDKATAICFLHGYAKSKGAGIEAKRAQLSQKEYWAFTLKQVECYRNTLYPGIWLQDGETVEDMAKEFASERSALEGWLETNNPPKTERQKENDKVKRMLRSYQYSLQQIDAACDEIEKLDSRRKRITVQYRDVHGGGGSDFTEAVIDNIQRLEREIESRTRRLADEERKVRFWIENLEDFRIRNVLVWCYLNGLRFEDVAEKLNYNYDYVRRLHGIGIDQLRVLIKNAAPKK